MKQVLDVVPLPYSAHVATASCVSAPARGTLQEFSVETLNIQN